MKRLKTPDARTRTIAYIRVSTEQQATEGVSLEAQEAKLRAYADLYDLDLVAVEIDAGESASTLERPALQRALAMLRRGDADALLVVKLDRLTRSVRDLGHLVERYFTKRASLLSVSEQIDTRSASGRGVLNILASVGQMERELAGERTAAVKSRQRQLGQHRGGYAPFGYALEIDLERSDATTTRRKLVPFPEEQEVITKVLELRARGLSIRAIAATLTEAGVHARGMPMSPGRVQRALAYAA